MKKEVKIAVLGVVLLLGGCASILKKSEDTANGEKAVFIERQLASLEQLGELHKEIKDIDRSLEKLQPVAIVKNNVYFVFDLDRSGEKYEFIMEHPVEMELPQRVRAVFPLGFYDKETAVITEDAFETVEKQIAVFHEFVHCFQGNEVDLWKLKMTLDSARDAYENKNYQWELNHPFPYTSDFFVSKTEELDKGYDIGVYHKEIKAALSKQDFEYMIWQEFIEGHAIYIENRIRERLGVHTINIPLTLQAYAAYLENFAREIAGVSLAPIHSFDRNIFYEIGSRYIVALIQNDAALKGDIKALFQKMINCGL